MNNNNKMDATTSPSSLASNGEIRKPLGNLPANQLDVSPTLPSFTPLKRRLLHYSADHDNDVDDDDDDVDDDDDDVEESPQNVMKILEDKENFKPTLRALDMVVGEEYNILKAKKVATKYGIKVVLELEDGDLFLPKKYDDLNQNIIKALSSGKFYIKNLGENGATYKYQFVLKE